MRKRTIVILAATLLFFTILAAVIYLYSNLNAIVERAIEHYGSEAAGTKVTVSSVKIDIRKGKATIRGLSVANPAGFSNNAFFRLGDITVDFDTHSLTKDVPVIEEIRIAAPLFRYEVNDKAESNVAVLKRHIKKYSGKSHGEKKVTERNSKPIKLRIAKVRIDSGRGRLDLSAVGGKQSEGKLGPIVLTDIGGKEGVTPANLSRVIITTLIRNLEESAARHGAERALQRELERKLGKEGGVNATEGIKGLLGR
jgi:hypothetical protein